MDVLKVSKGWDEGGGGEGEGERGSDKDWRRAHAQQSEPINQPNKPTDQATDLVLQAGLDRKRLVEEPLVKLLLGLCDHYDGHAPGVKLGAAGAAHHLVVVGVMSHGWRVAGR